MADCTTEIFCQICESSDHVAAKCPLKKNHPMAYLVGTGVDNLGFFYIPHGTISVTKNESTTALTEVQGGNLTAEQLIGHLKRLVSGKFDWDVQLQEPNVWVAPFPSKADLKRTVNFGAADLKNVLTLKFEEFEEEEYFGDEMPLVWMKVTNLPKALRTYEVIWAIGTMIGATTKVDMIYTTKNKFGRFQVAVLNPAGTPNQLDVVIGKRYFELKFVVESHTNPAASSSGTAMDDDKDGGEDPGKEDKSRSHKQKDDADRELKRAKASSTKQTENFNKTGDTVMDTEEDGQLDDCSSFDRDEDDLLDYSGEEPRMSAVPQDSQAKHEGVSIGDHDKPMVNFDDTTNDVSAAISTTGLDAVQLHGYLNAGTEDAQRDGTEDVKIMEQVADEALLVCSEVAALQSSLVT